MQISIEKSKLWTIWIYKLWFSGACDVVNVGWLAGWLAGCSINDKCVYCDGSSKKFRLNLFSSVSVWVNTLSQTYKFVWYGPELNSHLSSSFFILFGVRHLLVLWSLFHNIHFIIFAYDLVPTNGLNGRMGTVSIRVMFLWPDDRNNGRIFE